MQKIRLTTQIDCVDGRQFVNAHDVRTGEHLGSFDNVEAAEMALDAVGVELVDETGLESEDENLTMPCPDRWCEGTLSWTPWATGAGNVWDCNQCDRSRVVDNTPD